jgi:hypothetical protein
MLQKEFQDSRTISRKLLCVLIHSATKLYPFFELDLITEQTKRLSRKSSEESIKSSSAKIELREERATEDVMVLSLSRKSS